MHLHHPQGTIRVQAQTNRALAMRLRWDRRSGSVLLRRLRWTRRSSLFCRRRSWRSSRRRRICGTASHERSRQLKLSYALSFGLEFFRLTLTLLLSFVLFLSFLSLQLRLVGNTGGKLLYYPLSFCLQLCWPGSLALSVGTIRPGVHRGFFFFGQRFLSFI